MTIREAVLFQGGYIRAYEDLLKERVARFEADDAEPAHLSLDEIAIDGETIKDVVNDDSAWLSPERVLVIDQLQAWRAPDINSLVSLLKSTDTEWSVAFVQRSGEPVKAISSVLTEEVHDHRIPFDPDDLAEWIEEWLEERGVQLKRGVARELADHGGEDLGVVVEAVATVADARPGERLSWEDVLDYLGDAGSVPMFRLTGAIAKGDKEGALDTLNRLLNSGSHELQILAMLKNRYRSYGMLVDQPRLRPEDAAQIAGCSPGAARYVMQEARTLGKDRVVRALSLIAKTDAGLKGGAALDPTTQMQVLVIRLAQQFRVATR